MKLSIIIVSYNTKALTEACIESIYASPPTTTFEVIVVDNASTDASGQAVKKLIQKHSNLKLIENSDNVGFSKANNQAIKAAKGQYLLLLNSDTKVLKGSLDTLLDFAQNHHDAAVVLPRLLNADGSTQGSVLRLPNVFRAIRHYWFDDVLLDKYSPRDLSQVEAGVMAAFLITPKAIKKVGNLNEKYFMYYEDLDYCREVKKKKLKIYFLPKAQIIHYHGASGVKVAESKDQWKRLIPSSIIYHGALTHYLITAIIRLSQKLGKYLLPLLIALLTIPAIFQLVKPGYFAMQDDLQAFRVYEMDRCYDDLQIPCRWIPDGGYQYGYPQFNYYPPLPYYAGAFLHRIGMQYIDAVKVLFIAGYILSALAMYILVKNILGKWSGFVAGLLYTYIPYKAVEVYVRGALSEFWAQIFFPLILWAIYKLIKSGKTKHLLLLAIFIAALATTHVLMTVIFIPVAGVWTIFWLVKKYESWEKTGLAAAKLTCAGLLGFGLSAFFILPVMFERQYAHLESLLSGYFDYRQHFVSLQKLFLSMEWGYGSSGFPNEKLNLSLGTTQWILGIVVLGILAVVSYKKHKQVSQLALVIVATTLAVVFMIHIRSSFIWSRLPFLWFLQFPWRFLAPAIFLLVLACGLAVKLSRNWQYLLGLAAILASFTLYINFFVPKEWFYINDAQKFSGNSWEKQLTISIFDYLPIYAMLPPNHKAPAYPEVLDGEVEFSTYDKGSDFQTSKLEVIKEATIRLPLMDFPGMKVTLDQAEIGHRNDDCRGEEYCFGLITIELDKGSHDLWVGLTDTPVRAVGNWLTLVSLGFIAYFGVQSKKNAKRSSA